MGQNLRVQPAKIWLLSILASIIKYFLS